MSERRGLAPDCHVQGGQTVRVLENGGPLLGAEAHGPAANRFLNEMRRARCAVARAERRLPDVMGVRDGIDDRLNERIHRPSRGVVLCLPAVERR